MATKAQDPGSAETPRYTSIEEELRARVAEIRKKWPVGILGRVSDLHESGLDPVAIAHELSMPIQPVLDVLDILTSNPRSKRLPTRETERELFIRIWNAANPDRMKLLAGAPVDSPSLGEKPVKSDNPDMADTARPDVDLKLEAAEARMDKRLAEFQLSVQASLHANDRAMSEFRLDMGASRVGAADLRTDIANFKTDIVTAIAPLKGVKSNIWGAAGVIAALIVSALALMVSSFDSGRDTSQAAFEAKTIAADSKRLLEEIRGAQQAQVTRQTPASSPAAPASR